MEYVTVAELAARLQLNKNTLLRAIRGGALQSTKFGRHHRLSEEAVAAWLLSKQQSVRATVTLAALHSPNAVGMYGLLKASTLDPYFICLRADDTIEIPGCVLSFDEKGHWVARLESGKPEAVATAAAWDKLLQWSKQQEVEQ